MAKTKTPGQKMHGLKILGMMTGTSCDGLDFACVEFSPDLSPLWTRSVPYPSALKKRVLEAQKPGVKLSLKDCSRLDHDLGLWYGREAKKAISSVPKKMRPDVVASHGQTVGHFPPTHEKGFTIQWGDPSVIAVETGLTVISHFRHGDMAAGGQGAPLAPLFHWVLAEAFQSGAERKGIAIHNLGGVSNLTYISPNPNHELIAFDTGPSNFLIDEAASRATHGKLAFDLDGKLALKGHVESRGLERALKHPFFKLKPPKSTGRDDFPFDWFAKQTKAKGPDLVATATWLTIESIAQAYEKFILERKLPLEVIFLSGGGAKNPCLVQGLQIRLPEIEIASLTDLEIDPQFIEAQAFALFGFLSLLGTPIGGSWTGIKGFAPPGWITPGKNWGEVRALSEKISHQN